MTFTLKTFLWALYVSAGLTERPALATYPWKVSHETLGHWLQASELPLPHLRKGDNNPDFERVSRLRNKQNTYRSGQPKHKVFCVLDTNPCGGVLSVPPPRTPATPAPVATAWPSAELFSGKATGIGPSNRSVSFNKPESQSELVFS